MSQEVRLHRIVTSHFPELNMWSLPWRQSCWTSSNISKIVSSLRLSTDVHLFTCAARPRPSVRPGRSSSAAVCPPRGPSGLQGHTETDKKPSVTLGTGELPPPPDRSWWPAGTRPTQSVSARHQGPRLQHHVSADLIKHAACSQQRGSSPEVDLQ